MWFKLPSSQPSPSKEGEGVQLVNMNSKYSLIIFDLDGTLIDSRQDIVDSANRMLNELDLPQKGEEVIASFVGHGLGNLLLDCIGLENKHLADKALAFFKKDYEEHMLDKTCLFPEVDDVLQTIFNGYFDSEVIQTVVTNKPLYYSEKILQLLKAHHYFKVILGGDMPMPKKPAPDSVQHLSETFKVPKEQILFVGDSLVDMQTANNAGVDSCAVTFGFGSLESLTNENPTYVINNFSELLEII